VACHPTGALPRTARAVRLALPGGRPAGRCPEPRPRADPRRPASVPGPGSHPLTRSPDSTPGRSRPPSSRHRIPPRPVAARDRDRRPASPTPPWPRQAPPAHSRRCSSRTAPSTAPQHVRASTSRRPCSEQRRADPPGRRRRRAARPGRHRADRPRVETGPAGTRDRVSDRPRPAAQRPSGRPRSRRRPSSPPGRCGPRCPRTAGGPGPGGGPSARDEYPRRALARGPERLVADRAPGRRPPSSSRAPWVPPPTGGRPAPGVGEREG